MPSSTSPKRDYVNVGLHGIIYEEIKDNITKSGRYRSVSEFVHEAVRLRLEQLHREGQLKGT